MEPLPEYFNLMNNIVCLRLNNEAVNNELVALGLDGSNWPDCEPKQIAIAFNKALKYGYKGAKASVMLEHGDYLDQVYPKYQNRLSEKDKAVESIKREGKKHLSRQLSQELQTSPENFDALVAKYLGTASSKHKLFNLKDSIVDLVKENERLIKSGDSFVTIPGFEKLSSMISGFNPGSITQIAAETGVGKTNLMVSLALKAIDQMDVLFINMEMIAHDFGSRFVHNLCQIDNYTWRNGSYVNQGKLSTLEKTHEELTKKNDLIYTDGAALSAFDIEALIYSKFGSKRKGLVLIDYDTKTVINSGTDKEWLDILNLYVKMESVAKACNVHIIIAAQANEDGRSKASKRSEQPCANILNFYKEQGAGIDKYFVRAMKTRFNSKKVLEMDADLSTSTIVEKDFVTAQVVQPGGKKWI